MSDITQEQQAALDALRDANLKAQQSSADKVAAEAKRRANRFSFTVRGFAVSHHTGAPADIEAKFKAFVDQLRADGHEAHYAASDCGDIGHEQHDEY